MYDSSVQDQRSPKWPRVAVVGAGAVGAYFGARLVRAGASVVMVGRKPFVDQVKRDGLTVESQGEMWNLAVEVSTDLSACRDAQLVLFCVKTIDTLNTARLLEAYLPSDAVLLTMQNGVESVSQILATLRCNAIAAAVYVAVAMPEPAHVRHFGRGDLVLGHDPTSRQVARVWQRAGISCRVTENILGELWTKLLMNCALNALSALTRSDYARIVASQPASLLIEAIVSEFMEVAHAAGVDLPGIADSQAAAAAVRRLVAQMPTQHSSMAQDLMRGRRTEIDSLNGYIQRRGAQLGIRTPANQALLALIKLAETAAFES